MSLVRIGLSPRAPGLSRAAAQERWAGVHACLFARVPHVKSYVQNHAVLTDDGEPLLEDPHFDVFSEVEFECEADMAAAMASPWYRNTVIPDERQLLDATRRCFLVTRRFGAVNPVVGAQCKLVEFIIGEPSGVLSSFPQAWRADKRLAALFEPPNTAAAVYVVDAVGGAIARPVEVVVARWCEGPQEACETHHRICLSLQGAQGLSVHAAVVVRENQVIPRHPAVLAHHRQ